MGRSPSPVSREVARHGGRHAYRASEADAHAWERARRPKPCHLARYPELRWCVAEKLALDWSPEQISGWLKREFPADQGLQVSPETLYRSLFVQARGVLKKELMDHLRAGRRMRHPKGGTTPSQRPGQLVDAVSIRERPAEVEDRAVPGHWEGDLLSGANNSHMATLVERHSRFAMLIKVQGKDTASVVSALSKQVRQLPVELRRSLTWDRGKEMADHKKFTIATDVTCCAVPRSRACARARHVRSCESAQPPPRRPRRLRTQPCATKSAATASSTVNSAPDSTRCPATRNARGPACNFVT